MKAIKKIVAAAIAAVSIGAIGVTASAAETVEALPVDWMAVYQHGAPSSVNKKYEYTVEGRIKGYEAECTYFNGSNGSIVTVTASHSYGTYIYTMEGSYGFSGSTVPVTFTFSATGSSANTVAHGTIDVA